MANLADGRAFPDEIVPAQQADTTKKRPWLTMLPGINAPWPDPANSPVTTALFGPPPEGVDPLKLADQRMGLVASASPLGAGTKLNLRTVAKNATDYIKYGDRPAVDLTPSPKPVPDPLAVPAVLRRQAPITTTMTTNQVAGMAALARRRAAEMQALKEKP